jgi:hypothetical protein
MPCRLLTGGTLAAMSPNARQLYLFLALAADRRGLSFYGDARIQQILGFSQAELEAARTELLDRDLLACDGRDHQLLSLPERPASISAPSRSSTPSHRASCGSPRDAAAFSAASTMPVEIRETLRALFGSDAF